MTAAQLLKNKTSNSIALIEPADTHFYQPAWTLVGAGTFDFKKTARPMSSVIPKGTVWIEDKVTGVNANLNKVIIHNSGEISYDYLVITPGLVYDFSMVPGLKESIDKDLVCSIYTNPKKTWDVIKNFKGGTAIFTQPATPIKCGGAPQKIMYLAASYWAQNHVKSKTDIVFATPGTVIFGTKEIADTLMKVVHRRDINLRFFHKLVSIDAEQKLLGTRSLKT